MIDLASIAASAGAIGEALKAAGFTESAVRRVLDVEVPLSRPGRAQLPIYARRARGEAELESLVRLLFLGLPVPARSVPAVLLLLQAHGLVELRDGLLTPHVSVTPVGDQVFFHDREDAGRLSDDHVLGIGPAPRSLAALTVHKPVESALDLGTGCGVQALLLAPHAAQITATDVNRRALAFGQMNAAVNGISNVTFIEGSLFEPVEGQTFDTIVANPPFVLSPDRSFVYRDGGGPHDSLGYRVLREAPAYLNEGGFAHVLCSWVIPSEEEWARPVTEMLQDSGCDVWVLGNQIQTPEVYAAQWNADLLRQDEQKHAETVQRWCDFFEAQGIRQICTGAVLLRKRSGTTWMKADLMPSRPRGSAGNHVLRVFAAQDFLNGRELQHLLDQVLTPIDGYWLDQRTTYRNDAYEASSVQVEIPDTAGIGCDVPALATQVLLRLDGRRKLRTLVREAADETGLTSSQITAVTLPAIQKLLGLGLLDRKGRK